MEYSMAKKVVQVQLLKCATSVAANYRAACRGRSDREFIAKLNIVLEEADESLFWLEVIMEMQWANVIIEAKEANELTAIFVTMLKNSNAKLNALQK
jgi:four helix bundle protein